MDIPKIRELSKLFELKELRDVTAAVSALSEEDARSALVIAILLNQQNKDLDATRLQQIQKIEDQLTESNKKNQPAARAHQCQTRENPPRSC